MKYKEIFKSWWFYALVVVYAIFSIITNLSTYGSLFFVEYVGIILGSFLGVWFFVTLFWALIKFFRWIFPKKK